ncbi:uncharacterized protein LOC114576340 [Exaiptasia diaphana]|uniref:BEN domain-containing protein n=1 Tax=Exaiptasia diaphana TaxID=2652724 RepID=A0A913YX27_EXADI|nr:uncharacterized protein LOC114576340 [Exaiptasia diaphana]
MGDGASNSSHKPPESQYENDKSCDRSLIAAPGKQELYAGSGVYISCVELHTILAKAMGKPQELLGQLVNYFFDDNILAKSVPLQESRAKGKNVLDQRIIRAIIVYSKKCHLLWVKENKVSSEERFDWGRIIRNKCITARRRLERKLKRQ